MSLKECECMQHTDTATSINIINMNKNTTIPHELNKFWASTDKQNLQLVVRDMVHNQAYTNITLIVSCF